MPINSEENIEVQEDGLFLKYSFTVDKGQEPLRIDKFLVDRIERASRNKLQEAIERKQVILDCKAVKSNYKVKPSYFI